MMALSATLEGSSQMTLLARTTRARLMKRTERDGPISECPISTATTPVSRTHVSRMSRTGKGRDEYIVTITVRRVDVGKQNAHSYLGVGIRVSATHRSAQLDVNWPFPVAMVMAHRSRG